MKVIDTLWFTNRYGTIGIVTVEEDVTGDRKAYIGIGRGIDKKVDTDLILAWGNMFSVDTLKRIDFYLTKKDKKGGKDWQLKKQRDGSPIL